MKVRRRFKRRLRRARSAARDEARFRRFAWANRDPGSAIAHVRNGHLTYVSRAGLVDLAEAVIGAHDLEGSLLEAGTALGGSAIVMAAAKEPSRRLDLYGTFELIPPPSERDGEDIHERYEVITSGTATGIAGDEYYGYHDDLEAEVRESLYDFGIDPDAHSITTHKGLYQDTLRPDGPITVAHIDCDWFDSVWTCLDRIEPHLVPGGRFIIDAYHTWSGCRTAVDSFFEGRSGYRFEHKARLHIIKA